MKAEELILEAAEEGEREGLFEGVIEEAFRDYAGRTGWDDVAETQVVKKILESFGRRYRVNPKKVAEELLMRAGRNRIEEILKKEGAEALKSYAKKDLRALAVMDARAELDDYLRDELPAVWALLQTVVEDDREAEEYLEYHGERFFNNLSRALTSPSVKIEPFIAGFPCIEGYDEHVFVAVKDRLNGIELLGGKAPLDSFYQAFEDSLKMVEKQAELVGRRAFQVYNEAGKFLEKAINSFPLAEKLLAEKLDIQLEKENDGLGL